MCIPARVREAGLHATSHFTTPAARVSTQRRGQKGGLDRELNQLAFIPSKYAADERSNSIATKLWDFEQGCSFRGLTICMYAVCAHETETLAHQREFHCDGCPYTNMNVPQNVRGYYNRIMLAATVDGY